jgi:hypothetical protein
VVDMVEREAEALRRELCPLVPALAHVCGVGSPVLKFLGRALGDRDDAPTERLRTLRLARFALEQVPADVRAEIERIATRTEPPAQPVGLIARPLRLEPTPGRTVLVVASRAVAAALVAVLTGASYRVRAASTYAEARREAAYLCPELVVVDILLPGTNETDGVALAHEFMDDRIPVLVLTSFRVVLNDPELAFLRRSCDRAELLDAVERMLPR